MSLSTRGSYLSRNCAVSAMNSSTAVVTSLYGDYVYVVEPEAPAADAQPASAAAPAEGALVARQVFVQLGRRQGDWIQVASGVEAGQTVVTSGQNKLSNNAPVSVNNAADPAAVASDGREGSASP